MRVRNFVSSSLIAALFAAVCVSSAFAQGAIYNSIPNPADGNYPSLGYEATSTSEFGDRLQFAGTSRSVLSVTQTMSSWGCESGGGVTCVTTPGSTFPHPITLNIYAVGAGNAPGALLGTFTQTFNIPYRPSASASCPGGAWFDGTSCFNGYATDITFNTGGLVVPNEVIYGIAYNTTHHGYTPIGEAASCYTEDGKCGYDSLNVALTGATTVGINPAPDDAYFATTYAPFYCDAGALGVGNFRLDAGCWTDFKPNVRFVANTTPSNANACKNGGWRFLTRANGTTFRNQGDCIQYVNTGR